ncbi:MAG: hypothetical protein FJ255_13035 [Phycisphaerae bacterium]|nr:hypothetical protein [Phycisphaerae bacterium]
MSASAWDVTDNGRLSSFGSLRQAGWVRTFAGAYGGVKQAMGFRQHLLRGLEKARAEWTLVCLAYNVRKLHGAAVA